MERIKVSKDFYLDEFICPEVYIKFKGSSIWFIDGQLIKIAQALRNEFGPVTINNWNSGGNFNYSGLRPPKLAIGATYSQHKFGNAIDLKFKDASPSDVRKEILNNKKYFRLGVRGLELKTPSWVHVDARNTGENTILTFNP